MTNQEAVPDSRPGPDLDRARDNVAEALDCALSFLIQSDQEGGFDTSQALANLRTIARELSIALGPDGWGNLRAWLTRRVREIAAGLDDSAEWQAEVAERAMRDILGDES